MKVRNTLLCAAFLLACCGPAAAEDCGIRGWFLSGSNPNAYLCGLEAVEGQPGKSAFLMSKRDSAVGYVTIMQQVSAEMFRGKRVRLTALMRTADARRAAIFMRVDGPYGKWLRFYNMDDRPVIGTTPWTTYSVVLDVPANSVDIAMGFLLSGRGKVWARTMNIEVVGNDVPVDRIPTPWWPNFHSFDMPAAHG